MFIVQGTISLKSLGAPSFLSKDTVKWAEGMPWGAGEVV